MLLTLHRQAGTTIVMVTHSQEVAARADRILVLDAGQIRETDPMTPLLWRALLRHPLRHPWQLGLAILGIALGVAVVLAVDLANASARRSFALAMERISGQATHRLVGDAQGIPEAWYVQMRVERGLRPSAPVVTGYLPNADRPGQLLQILGIDPFAEASVSLIPPLI